MSEREINSNLSFIYLVYFTFQFGTFIVKEKLQIISKKIYKYKICYVFKCIDSFDLLYYTINIQEIYIKEKHSTMSSNY